MKLTVPMDMHMSSMIHVQKTFDTPILTDAVRLPCIAYPLTSGLSLNKADKMEKKAMKPQLVALMPDKTNNFIKQALQSLERNTWYLSSSPSPQTS
jgi:hypothetical protein